MDSQSDNPSRTSEYFFTASTLKLVLMSIFTFGFYEFYWFYKNWVLIKQRTGHNIMPVWRATFSPLWAYSCFNHIKTAAIKNNIASLPPVYLLAVIYFFLNFLGWVLGAITDEWLLLLLFSLSFLPIIPINTMAVNLNKRLLPGFQNNRLTLSNWVILILGSVFILLYAAEQLLTKPDVQCAIIRQNPELITPDIMDNLDENTRNTITQCLKKGR